MSRPIDASQQLPSRVDLVWAALTGVAALGLFVATLQPDFGGPEDTPKFQFVGHVLGTPHPPGYPLYVVLSHFFVRLPIGTIAYRANLFSAVTAAIACALTFWLARQLGAARWAASGAALGLATGASFWLSAVFAEVYGLAAMMAALTMVLFLEWRERGGAARLLLAVAAFSLGMGNHLTLIGIVPACLLYVVLRDRGVLTPRVIAAATGVILLGALQYVFIIVRTRQGAPYLESAARSIPDLLGVMTARRFVDKRFSFSAAVLLTDHLPALIAVIGQELGLMGIALLSIGGVAAARARSVPAAVLAAAGAGMFVMVLNLEGDLRGFTTPMMVFIWPLAAVGATAIAGALSALHLNRRVAVAVAAFLAASAPWANLNANYARSDQSGDTESARFYRALFAQLPDRAGFVTEDYASDMALCYYLMTGEAGPSRGIERVVFNANDVLDKARDHRMFAFAPAAAVLHAQGLRFERWEVAGPSLDAWLGQVPAGSLIVGAAAYVNAPFDLSRIGHADVRAGQRPRAFEAFALVSRRPGAAWREDDAEATLSVDRAALGLPPTKPSQPVAAIADRSGARLELAGDTIARVATGRVVGLFAADGTLMRALRLVREPLTVPFQEAVYELKGTNDCVKVSTDGWTDVTPAFATGSWVATLPKIGSVGVETMFDRGAEVRVDGRELLSDGDVRIDRAGPDAGGGQMILTTLTRGQRFRPVFRVALDRQPLSARARVRPGGTVSSVTLCGDRPMNPLLRDGETVGTLEPNFESESYFGAGWSGIERTPTGRVRHGASGAGLWLPLAAASYRLSLDLVAAAPTSIELFANDAAVGRCEVRGRTRCEVALPAAVIRGGTNLLKFVIRSPSRDGGAFTLRGAQLERLPD